jgi:polar amino acid transport system substrate-binding protein
MNKFIFSLGVLMKYIIFTILIISSIAAKEFTIGVGLSLEPYIISKNDTGIELDIIKLALKNSGYKQIKIKYLPFLRVTSSLKNKKIDAATTINEYSGLKNVYYSNTHITYQNVLITLKSNKVDITKLDNLKDLKIVAFQNAHKYLGKQYKQLIPTMKFYQELADQKLQVKLLFAKRVDGIILDINIFKHIKTLIKDVDIDTNSKINIIKIFPKTNYKVAFLDKTIRDKFNIELNKIKKNGIYDKIFLKYIQ